MVGRLAITCMLAFSINGIAAAQQSALGEASWNVQVGGLATFRRKMADDSGLTPAL
jgi:hypothetical protein